MTKQSPPAPSSLTIRTPHGLAQLTALADDLFRLRITRAKSFSTAPSWAVIKTEWPSPAVKATNHSKLASLQTSKGLLRLRPADGAWELQDAKGRSILRYTIRFKKNTAVINIYNHEHVHYPAFLPIKVVMFGMRCIRIT